MEYALLHLGQRFRKPSLYPAELRDRYLFSRVSAPRKIVWHPVDINVVVIGHWVPLSTPATADAVTDQYGSGACDGWQHREPHHENFCAGHRLLLSNAGVYGAQILRCNHL